MYHTLQLSSGTLHVREEGVGKTILLVHGFPLDHSMWRHQIESLAQHYRVIAPDLLGFGRSSSIRGTLSMEACAQDLQNILQELQINDKIVFCGLSMGGYIAWQFAKLFPQSLAGLIVCDSRAAADAPEQARGRLVAAERLEREQQNAFLIESMLPRLFGETIAQQAPAFVKETIQVMQQTAPNSCAAALRGMAERSNMQPLLAKIACPALMLCGELDAIVPAAEMREIALTMPHATYAEISQAGHMAPLEKPTEVNAVLEHWLQTSVTW